MVILQQNSRISLPFVQVRSSGNTPKSFELEYLERLCNSLFPLDKFLSWQTENCRSKLTGYTTSVEVSPELKVADASMSRQTAPRENKFLFSDTWESESPGVAIIRAWLGKWGPSHSPPLTTQENFCVCSPLYSSDRLEFYCIFLVVCRHLYVKR